MIQSLLIANRGEIACRIIRTARAMGIRTVAIYSDADADALHVRQADKAVHIGASPPRESYLNGDRIIAAAKSAGAEAIHPGYGFLSENADFAQAVIDAGLIWVGPPPSAIAAMGLKDAAKRLMADAGVPVTPGYLGADQSPGVLAERAAEIGYPVLIKAVAGGGGKGMRQVDDPAAFAEALAACRREAASAFGNDRVIIEKFIARPRHIEVQVFGDAHGTIVHLFERDCSLQRRHQKVIEEAPAPGIDAATREALCCAAIRAAKAVDYVGAGTVEFIADASEGLRRDRIWFMEMNTRLQVEHPVTEEITGVDLVEWQLRVASGEPLPKRQEELAINGWAIEARLYAEDPARGFLPSTGRLEIFRPQRGIRMETGFAEGGEISGFYDPMIAKLVVHRSTRTDACEALARACAQTDIFPVKTNAPFLWRALDDPDFRSGNIDTSFIATKGDTLLPPAEPTDDMVQRAAAALLVQEYYGQPTMLHFRDGELLGTKTQSDPWRGLIGFRVNADACCKLAVAVDGRNFVIELPPDWHRKSVVGEPVAAGFAVNDDGLSFLAAPARTDSSHRGGSSSGAILAPMPGKVLAVAVTAGDAVVKGQKLLTLEAMKMEHALIAPFDGVVAELNTAAGTQVQVDALLARIEAEEY